MKQPFFKFLEARIKELDDLVIELNIKYGAAPYDLYVGMDITWRNNYCIIALYMGDLHLVLEFYYIDTHHILLYIDMVVSGSFHFYLKRDSKKQDINPEMFNKNSFYTIYLNYINERLKSLKDMQNEIFSNYKSATPVGIGMNTLSSYNNMFTQIIVVKKLLKDAKKSILKINS